LIDDAALDRFFALGKAVTRMGMPVVVAPPWERAQLKPAAPDAACHEPIAFNARLTHWRWSRPSSAC